MNKLFRNAALVWLSGLWVSVGEGCQVPVVDLEYEVELSANHQGPISVPTQGLVIITGPSGSWVPQSGWQYTHDGPDDAPPEGSWYAAHNHKSMPCMITNGVPMVFNFQLMDSSSSGVWNGPGWVKMTPPAWATTVYAESSDGLTAICTRTLNNRWTVASVIGFASGSSDLEFMINWGGNSNSSITLTFSGCQSCAAGGNDSPSSPSLDPGSSGSSPVFSQLPFGSACCGDLSQANVIWAPSDLAHAADPQSLYAGTNVLGVGTRFPLDVSVALQQFKVGASLGVVNTQTPNTLKWRSYDATNLGAPNQAGEYSQTQIDALPLLDEVIITRNTTTGSVQYAQQKSGQTIVQTQISQNGDTWQTENLLAGSRDTQSVSVSGTGDVTKSTTREEKDSAQLWVLVQSSATTTATINGLNVVIEEFAGGDSVATYGYYPDGRRKWTLRSDGSWEFYDNAGTSIYCPYGDTAFPGVDWTPSSAAGIRRDTHYGSSESYSDYSIINSTQVASNSGSINYDTYSYGQYAFNRSTTTNGLTTSTISTTASIALPSPFRSRTLREDNGCGVTTLHAYTRGNVDTTGFTADSNGNAVMIITSKGSSASVPTIDFYDTQTLILNPETIGATFSGAASYDVSIYDSKGRTVYTATRFPDGSIFKDESATVWSHTGTPDDAVTTQTRDGQIVSTDEIITNITGTCEQTTDEANALRITNRDLLGRVTTEILPGDGMNLITRTHIYDGLKTTIITTGGGLALTTVEARDLLGRVISSTDDAGIVTGYSYTDGGRSTSISHPGNVTDASTNYLDGRFKERSGSGVNREFVSYVMDGSGNEVTTRSVGPAVADGHGARWTETTTDALGRTMSVRRPGTPTGTNGRHADIVESYSYDSSTGKLSGITSSARPGIYQLSEENLLGSWLASGAATHTGSLVADSNDRFSTSTRTYAKRGGHFWEINTRSTFVSGASPVTTSNAVRLWVGDGEVSEFTDAANVTTTRTTSYDHTLRKVVTQTANPLQGTTTETAVKGYLKSRSLPGAAQDETFGYDGLGRQIRHTDVRNASTYTKYNAVGQVEHLVDHLGQSVSYTYHPKFAQAAGRVWTQTDAAGKLTTTQYDTQGRVSSITGNAAYPLSYSYNAFGDLETLTTYGSQTAITTWVHDFPTGVLLEKKYHGQSTGVKYTYNDDGKLASRTWRRGVTTNYGYCQTGNVFGDLDSISYSDGTPAVSFANFDRLGRPGTVTEGGNLSTLAYDALTGGTSTTYAPGHGVLPGLSVVMKSADAGRPGGYALNQGNAPLEDVSYGYDNSGRFGSVASAGHEIGYQYYPGTNIVRETTHTLQNGSPRVETRTVDLAGRLIGIVTTVPGGSGRRIAASAGYLHNDRGLREKLTREDGTSWTYGYNDRREVTSGVKKLANGSLAAGLQFGYQFDGIGNREWVKSGGGASGQNQRTATYTPNALNQYSNITTPGSFDVLVRSPNGVGVAVNESSVSVTGQGDFYHAEATATNTNGAWVGLDITSPPGASPHATGHHWLPPAVFSPSYDADGNLFDDGRWTDVWDAENRLVSQTTSTLAVALGVPRCKVENAYDWQSRRIQKKVSTSINGTTWTLSSDERFVYDGWNLLAVFNAAGSTLTAKQTFLWGLDLSGTLQGAGGVSGLLAANNLTAQSVSYPAFDGNGDIIAWTATNGDTLQRIDYDPFGGVVTREGVAGFEAPPFGFSTKYQDPETGLLYYGHRFYDPATGRWPSTDPIGENGGENLYGFVGNNGSNKIDVLGKRILTYENNEDYRNRIISALEQITGANLTWTAPPQGGVKQWILCVQKSGSNAATWTTLNKGISMRQSIKITNMGSYAENAFGKSSVGGYVGEVQISTDVNFGIYVEPSHTSSGGYIYYAKESTEFRSMLWHELAGHAILGLSHPNESWNDWSTQFHRDDWLQNRDLVPLYSPGQRFWQQILEWGKRVDPAINEENKARKALNLRPRAPFYYGWNYWFRWNEWDEP